MTGNNRWIQRSTWETWEKRHILCYWRTQMAISGMEGTTNVHRSESWFDMDLMLDSQTQHKQLETTVIKAHHDNKTSGFAWKEVRSVLSWKKTLYFLNCSSLAHTTNTRDNFSSCSVEKPILVIHVRTYKINTIFERSREIVHEYKCHLADCSLQRSYKPPTIVH